jgi:DNA-binding winged helix-turn-helix (wHTH) protein/tetratricopeptide (TPR) repeat protein
MIAAERSRPMAEPQSRSREVLEFGPFQLGVDDVLLRRGAPVALSPKESAVLRLLAAAGGDVVDKDTLVARVWAGAVVGGASPPRGVHHLRQRLGRRADGEDYIETLYGRGYRMTAPVRRSVRDRLMVVATASAADGQGPLVDALLDEIEDLLLVRGHDVFSLVLGPRTPATDVADALVSADARGAHVLAVLRGATTGAAPSMALQVIRARDGATLHDDVIDAPPRRDAAQTIAGALVTAILGVMRQRTPVPVPQRLLRTIQTEPRVYEAYSEARSLYKRRNPVGPEVVRLYEQALAWDPAYIPALLGLAECYLTQASWSVLDPNTAMALVGPLIRQVEALDASATGLLVLQAMITSGAEQRFDEAERLFRRALEEDGADTNAYRMYGRHLLHAGCPNAATQALRTCIDLDPFTPAAFPNCAYAAWCAGRAAEARALIARGLELHPESLPALAVGAALRACDSQATAADDSRRAYETSSGVPLLASFHADVCARVGFVDEARALLVDADASPAHRVFSMYVPALVALGEVERAAAWLARGRAARCAWWPTLRVDPRMQDVLHHPAVHAVFADLQRLPDAVDPLD